MISPEREKALENTIALIEKQYGKGAVMRFGDKNRMDVDVIPTGSLGLDIALGVGGIPRGRIVEIFGPEASGKTTTTLHIIAEAQKLGGVAAFVDAEHALDPVYAKKLGVNIDELYISQPDDGEQALEIAEAMVRSSAIDIIVIDSVAALVPRAEIAGDMGDNHMGLHARLMSQALRKITAFTGKTSCVVVFTNQLRSKIGVVYGNPEVTTGGNALKFYSSIRLDVRRAEALKIDGEIAGNRTRVRVVKNKVSPPFKETTFDMPYGEGVSRIGEIVDLGSEIGVVAKSGNWYSFGETRLGQGREAAKKFFKDNPDVARETENAIRRHFGLRTLDEMESLRMSDKVTEIAVKPITKTKGRPKKEDKKNNDEIAITEDMLRADEYPDVDIDAIAGSMRGLDALDNLA